MDIESDNQGLLSVEDLVNYFESSEDATLDARAESEIDRDYVDNKQLTDAEKKELERRGQPAIIINRVKRKVDFLRGYEMSQRVDPRVLPRTPAHEQDAEGAEQAIRYVAEDQNIDQLRSAVWDNLVVEGMGGYRVGVKPYKDGVSIEINRVPWDRMFYDPHSSERDFSDARYLGVVRWEDYDEAVRQYPDAKDMLETTLNKATVSDTFDDRPKYKVWADKKRRRVRICQIWVKSGDQWHWAEFTKGGILKSGPSPHVSDKGESECELIFTSAYVNRDNERYGLVREMRGPQDEINKRRSKALHLLNTSQMIYEDGAFQNPEEAHRQANRPDGKIRLNPGHFEKFKFERSTELAAGHMQLLQEAKNEIDMMAGNIALQGDALNKSAASGKAIIASQQGGAMEIAAVMDALRHADVRLFRAIWSRIRQYWTEEKWVRVTDDERNIKWLGLNVDPMQMQMMASQNPQMMEKVAGVVANVAELDCDIIIDDAPDGLTPQLEQFQSLVELKKMDANGELPFKAIVMAMPNLRNKEQILAQMDQSQQSPEQAQAQQMAMQLQMQGAQAEVAEKVASARLKEAQAVKAMSEAGMVEAPQGGVGPSPFEMEMQANETAANVEDTLAAADLKRAQTAKTMQEIQLAPQKMAHEAQMKREQFAMRNRQAQ